MGEGEGAFGLADEHEGFAEEGKQHVDLHNGFNIRVIKPTSYAGCGAGNNNHESMGRCAFPCHGAMGWFLAVLEQHFFVSEIVEFPNCGVATEVIR